MDLRIRVARSSQIQPDLAGKSFHLYIVDEASGKEKPSAQIVEENSERLLPSIS